jgi:hypothetical protein
MPGPGRLAQLAERRPYKPVVGGSSPSAPTTQQDTNPTPPASSAWSARLVRWLKSAAMGAAPMPNGRHLDCPSGVIDEVRNPVVATSGRPSRIERRTEWLTDPSGVIKQGTGDEGTGGRGDLGRKHLGQRAQRRPSDPEAVPLLGHRLGRRPALRIISVSSSGPTLSPRSSATLSSMWSLTSTESSRTAIVSCSVSRSLPGGKGVDPTAQTAHPAELTLAHAAIDAAWSATRSCPIATSSATLGSVTW